MQHDARFWQIDDLCLEHILPFVVDQNTLNAGRVWLLHPASAAARPLEEGSRELATLFPGLMGIGRNDSSADSTRVEAQVCEEPESPVGRAARLRFGRNRCKIQRATT